MDGCDAVLPRPRLLIAPRSLTALIELAELPMLEMKTLYEEQTLCPYSL